MTHLWVLREGFPEEGLKKVPKEGARGGRGASLLAEGRSACNLGAKRRMAQKSMGLRAICL